VARLAGLPRDVITRAQEVLARLESGMSDPVHIENASGSIVSPPDPTLPMPHPLLEEVRQMDLFRMTPLEALNKLSELKERLEHDSH
jgi:DNA mismatch repair protein MutS